MNLAPLNITALLRTHGLQPKKSLGQNFLADTAALQRVVDAAEITPDLHVLEVGAGLGSLTRCLAVAARRVVAVELDAHMLPILSEVLAPHPNVEIVHADILTVDVTALMGGAPFIVAANIPYYITSALIRHLLESPVQPLRMVLTVQREVAERICAAPGKLSLLALSVQLFGRARIAGRIPAGAFFPAPTVDSAIVRIDLYEQPQIPAHRIEQFFQLAHAGFSQKRKTLRNSLSAGMGVPPAQAEAALAGAGIDPQRRAETLSIPEWNRLVEAWKGSGDAQAG